MNDNENITTSASQNDRIAAWLRAGRSITALEALNMFGCFRLASRISDLRRKGMDIESGRITTSTGKLVASYRMKSTQSINQ